MTKFFLYDRFSYLIVTLYLKFQAFRGSKKFYFKIPSFLFFLISQIPGFLTILSGPPTSVAARTFYTTLKKYIKLMYLGIKKSLKY